MRLAWSTGIAKPSPIEPLCASGESPPSVAIAELTPISCPLMSTNAPPELPGLIAASVWMASSTVFWLADPQVGRRPDADRRQPRNALHANHCDVGGGVSTDNGELRGATVGERHRGLRLGSGRGGAAGRDRAPGRRDHLQGPGVRPDAPSAQAPCRG